MDMVESSETITVPVPTELYGERTMKILIRPLLFGGSAALLLFIIVSSLAV